MKNVLADTEMRGSIAGQSTGGSQQGGAPPATPTNPPTS
jgi:hypothetical protein